MRQTDNTEKTRFLNKYVYYHKQKIMKAKIAMYLKVLYIHNDEVKLSIPE